MTAGEPPQAHWTADAYDAIGLLSSSIHLIEQSVDAEEADGLKWATNFTGRLRRLLETTVPLGPDLQRQWRDFLLLIDALCDEVRIGAEADAIRSNCQHVTARARVLRDSYPAAGRRRGAPPEDD